MKCSFIIYFHHQRIDNLKQTIRFLTKREPDLIHEAELILICQDYCDPFPTAFATQWLNLHSKSYNKPLMNNIGVKASNSDILVLLDSDRILPQNFFTRNIKNIHHNSLITASEMYYLSETYTDNDLETESFRYTLKSKCIYEMHCRGVFSGNTILTKDFYLQMGGMDESFVGYGYADTDFAQTAKKNNANVTMLPEMELHLFHDRGDVTQYQQSNLKNGIKYCKKWGIEPNQKLIDLGRKLNINVNLEIAS